jgi:hypothetical protein
MWRMSIIPQWVLLCLALVVFSATIATLTDPLGDRDDVLGLGLHQALK